MWVVLTFLVQAGPAVLALNLDASTASAEWTPAGQVATIRANVICKVAGVPGWGMQSVAGLSIALGDITLMATDALTPAAADRLHELRDPKLCRGGILMRPRHRDQRYRLLHLGRRCCQACRT